MVDSIAHTYQREIYQPSEKVAIGSSSLREEYEYWRSLYECQPSHLQRFLKAQARQVIESLSQASQCVRITLPDQVIVIDHTPAEKQMVSVPLAIREQRANRRFGVFRTGSDMHLSLRKHLLKLEQSKNLAIVTGAGLIRFAIAWHCIHDLLPEGQPMRDRVGTSTVFSPVKRNFFLSQWIAFDESNKLLTETVEQAAEYVSCLCQYQDTLGLAVFLAPYMVCDEEYQVKHYGISGQLIDQGRALAYYQTQEIINKIKNRVSTNNLNRGLSLSVPYFDDQAMRMMVRDFVVIPRGRTLFIPAFVVLAIQSEKSRIATDSRLNATTRQHLIHELDAIERAFSIPHSIR